MTVAKFYSSSGRPYTDIGVAPDVVVRSETSLEIGQDAQLQAAVDIARPLTMAHDPK
jgi:C-terminal processing protease CtpA/Prc